MALKYFTDLSLEQNQLLEASLQRVTQDPLGFVGQIIYNTSENTFKFYNGIEWKGITGDYPTLAEFNQEVQDRIAGDANLQSQVDTLDGTTAQLISDLALEIQNRITADNILQGNIDTEETARIAGDNSLQAQIDAISENDTLDTVTTRGNTTANNIIVGSVSVTSGTSSEFLKADGTKDNTSYATSGNLDVEEAARIAADNTLQGNIDAEATTRANADTTLQGNIDSEATARIAADGVLQTNINNEESARIAADSTLQNNIDSEESARITADTALQGQIDSNDTDITNLQTDKQDISEKGQANGYASLDSGAKIIEAELPDSILGQVVYEGTWDASTNTPTLANPPASDTKGEYYVTSTAGTQFGIDFEVGDWVISNGTAWEKVDNSDAVTTVFGRLGNIIANSDDYASFYLTLQGVGQFVESIKTFQSLRLRLDASGGFPTYLSNTGGSVGSVANHNSFGFNSNNDIYFSSDISGNSGVLRFNNTSNRFYDLQDASGTLAFTSDINDTLDSVTTRGNTTTNAITVGDTTVNGKIQIDVTAITGREDILFGTISDSTPSKFGIANGTTTTGQFVPAMYGYQNVDRPAFNIKGFGNSSYDQNTSEPLFVFSVSNTSSSTDPLNGTLTPITQRDAFLFETVSFDYMRIKANGDILLSPTSGTVSTGGDFVVDTDTLFVDASANRVGIGTSSPNQLMEISGAAGEGTTPPTLRITNTTFYGSTGIANVPHHAIEFYQEEASGNYPAVAAAIKTINFNEFGVAHALAFYTNFNSSVPTERMRIDSSGNVGIGTDNPANKLDVVGNINVNDTSFFRYNGDTGLIGSATSITGGVSTQLGIRAANDILFATNGVSERMRITSTGNVGIGTVSPTSITSYRSLTLDGTTGSILDLRGGGTLGARIVGVAGGMSLETGGATPMNFSTNGTERMTIDSSGNVGIGTTSPSAKLEVNGIIRASGTFADTGQNPLLQLYNTDTSLGANQILGDIDFYQSDASGTGAGVVSRIRSINESSFQGEAGLAFHTGTTGGLTERMRITSSGNVGIGTASPSAKLHLVGGGVSTSISDLVTTLTTRFDVANPSISLGIGYVSADIPILQAFNNSSNTSSNLTINPFGGNVGIGTSSPAYKLQVSGGDLSVTSASNTRLILNNTSGSGLNYSIYSADTGNLIIGRTGVADYMALTSSGNVGIGTSSPTWMLEVNKNTSGASVGQYPAISVNNPNASGYSAFYFFSGATNKGGLEFFNGDNSLRFFNGSERMRITSSGNVGIGTASPSARLFTTSPDGSDYSFGASGTTRGVRVLHNSTGTFIQGVDNTLSASYQPLAIGGSVTVLETNGSERMRITSSGQVTVSGVATFVPSAASATVRFAPEGDGTVDLGLGFARWEEVFSVNGTINTSDANEKQQIEDLDEAELNVAKSIKGLIKKFKWNTAVEEKGENARIHVGVIAQDVKAAFEAEGLDPDRYSLFTSDTWWEKEVIEIDEEGVERTKIEVLEEYEEGSTERTRLGIRYNELLSFVIAAI